MPDYTTKAPGVYVESIPAVGPIQGVGTSTAAFIGSVAQAGAPTSPTMVTNWTQYKSTFGDYDGTRKMLPYAVRGFFDNGGTQAYIVADGTLSAALDALTRYDVNLVVAPDVTGETDQLAILTHCRNRKNCFAILNAAVATTQENVAKQAGTIANANDRGYGAIYYPWIRVSVPTDATVPITGQTTVDVPPAGHLAGIYARCDGQRGVHKAPANEVIQGAVDLVALINDTEHGTLNAAGVNALRIFPASPPMVWGARSLTKNTAYRYVNVERLLIYLEQSMQAGLRWAVFEPNDFTLWKKLERTLTEFLTRVWQSGALFGRSADRAFFIKVDEELNTPDTRALGEVIVEVGVAPVRPAEFVIIRLALREGAANGQA